MARFGHALGSPTYIKDKLEYQASRPVPKISADFLYGSSTFLAEYGNALNYMEYVQDLENVPNGIPPELSKARDAIGSIRPKEGEPEKDYLAQLTDASNKIFKNGYSKLAVLDVSHLSADISQDHNRMEVCSDFIRALQSRFGLVAAPIPIKDKEGTHGVVTNTLLGCLQTKFVRQPGGQWIEEAQPKAAQQFFAMAVAKGLVSEKSLYDSSVMLGSRNYETLALIKQLKDEGVKPILETPLPLEEKTVVLSR